MKTPRDIKQYTDFREFLLQYATERKGLNRGWSFGVWAKSLGLKSTSSLSKVLQGERGQGAAMTARLVEFFQFNTSDAEYFRDLIRLEKAKGDPGLHRMITKRVQQEQSGKPIKRIDYEMGAVIANWCAFPIRELAKLPKFIDDSKALAQKFLFNVTPEQVRAALKALFDANLLERDENGSITVPASRVATGDDIPSEAIKRYHESMLDNSKAALRIVPVDQREFFGSTLLVSSEDVGDMKLFIREFRSKFAKRFEATDGDQLYQIQLQLFPLLKSTNDETGGMD